MSLSRRSVLLAAALLAVGLLALGVTSTSLTGSARATAPGSRLGLAPRLPRGSERAGALAGGTPITVSVALAPRDAGALAAYADAVSQPGNPDYHRYLDVTQLRARFAPTSATLARVRRALTAAGLPRGRVSANGLLVDISASARILDHAFRTRIDRVRLADGRVAYANAQAPRVPAQIGSLIQGVVGLSDLEVPHALGLAREVGIGRGHANARADAARATATSAPSPSLTCGASSVAARNRAYTADEVASAYGFDDLYSAGDYGAGQTVGLMEFEEYATSDVQGYESCYGIDSGTASDVTTTLVDRGVNSNGTSTGSSGSGEAALDIEQILGLAPAADVDVYEAPDTESGMLDAYTAMVDNSAIKVISTSWGECEALDGSGAANEESTVFEEAAAAGKSVFAAAGDDGSTDCSTRTGAAAGTGVSASSPAVDDPGSQPDVTSVGGTSLPSAADAAGQSVWNDSSIENGAGGGGVSTFWTMPTYQRQAASALGVIGADSSASPCGARTGGYCRQVPDVSADADPQTGYVIDYKGAWTVIGGTSAAAPLWAAIAAEANASSACTGTQIGQANPVLYDVADDTSAYSGAFTDITAGSTGATTNDYSPSGYSGGLYPAGTGYDMATGLGAPDVGTLAPDMCAVATSQPIPASTSSSGSTASSSSGQSTTTTVTISSPVTTTPASTPTSTSTTTATASSPTSTASSGSGSSSGVSTGSGVTAVLRSAPDTLALSAHRHSAELLFALDLPAGYHAASLSLVRKVSTLAHRGAHGLDTLRVQVLTSSGSLIATLASVSNHDAGTNSASMTLSLTRYLGRGLILRFLATGTGTRATSFTLRSIAVRVR